ncbi:nuclease-related domain-containing protein [Bacillus solitudinis]|uniref:nuclease-related domain-containing protein n=1 Tax=Bacillus solitudinis TaxID=2014074 RepID=UPI000C234942|nr:nuclease-related domain-containing protein [Bacillus solitudinis]
MLSKFIKMFSKGGSTKEKVSNAKTKPKQKEIRNKVTATRIGELGEYKIDIQLDQLSKEYKCLSDLMVKNQKSKTGYSQIDHIVITPYGIIVIETKNYQGTIYGGKGRKTWLVNGKFKFMNPFVQNYGHIQALKGYLDTKYSDVFISMVSFTKRCTFKIDDIELRKISSNEIIVYDIELSDFIHRKLSVMKLQHKEPLLSEKEINSIYNVISDANIIDIVVREKHVTKLKENKEHTVKQPQHPEKCVVCSEPVSEKVKTYCLSNKKFKEKVYCFQHQKNIT